MQTPRMQPPWIERLSSFLQLLPSGQHIIENVYDAVCVSESQIECVFVLLSRAAVATLVKDRVEGGDGRRSAELSPHVL